MELEINLVGNKIKVEIMQKVDLASWTDSVIDNWINQKIILENGVSIGTIEKLKNLLATFFQNLLKNYIKK